MLLSVKHAAFLILPYMLVAFAPFGFVWAFKRIKLGLMVKEDRTGNFLFGFIHLAGSLLGCALVIGI